MPTFDVLIQVSTVRVALITLFTLKRFNVFVNSFNVLFKRATHRKCLFAFVARERFDLFMNSFDVQLKRNVLEGSEGAEVTLEAFQFVVNSSDVTGKIWGQFHHHSTSSFYAHRSQKCKKDCQVKQFFCAFRICGRKSCS